MANFTPQEIEEMLREFFDVTGKRQYVGARYIPIFGRKGESSIEWDNSSAYEPLTIVLYQGNSYTSRQYVPTGIDIFNTDFWVQSGNWNAQIEQYRQEVLRFQDQIDEKVPYPIDPNSKYGILGQVLSTLANGETKWEDPVTVDATIAEPIIDAWLSEHPEATTTVEDGSITDAKMSKIAGQLFTTALKSNGSPITPSTSDPNIKDFNNVGTAIPSNSIIRYSGFNTTNPLTNAPFNDFSGTLITISINSTTTYAYQFAIAENHDRGIWYRFFIPSSSSTWIWKQLGDENTFTRNSSPINKIGTYSPANVPTNYRDLNVLGSSGIRNNGYIRYYSFSANDTPIANAPTTPFNGTVIMLADSDTSTFALQIAIAETGMWFRLFNPNQSWTHSWIEISTTNNVLTIQNTPITPSNYTSDTIDLNKVGTGFQNNSIIRYASFTSTDLYPLNAPTIPFNGLVLNYSTNKTYTFGVQIAVEQASPSRMWYRFFIHDTLLTHQWTRLVSADEIATNVHYVSTASELFQLLRTNPTGIINLETGIYDFYTGLIEPLILNDSFTSIYLTNDLTINGNGSEIRLQIPDEVAVAHSSTANNISILDLRGNIELNDINFNCYNTRYCVHFESLLEPVSFNTKAKFNNCVFTYSRGDIWLNATCVGLGGSKGQKFEFNNCMFNNDAPNGFGIYIHGRTYTIGHLNIINCIFNITTNQGLLLSQFTGQTTPVDVCISTSKVGIIKFQTQTGGNTNNQFRVNLINSISSIIVDENTTLLYPYTIITTIGE